MRFVVTGGVLLTVLLALVGAFNARQENAEPDWWEGGVFYQIYPLSFRDGDGDGQGDLKGITERLEHLVDLGVDGVWFNPMFKSPMADFGYDISDFRDINPIFGTMADLEAMVARAHELGIKVLLDFVPNHSSDEHDWFVQSAAGNPEYRDFYTWRDGMAVGESTILPPNNWIAVFHTPAWTQYQGGQFYLHQFDKKQPDLNYRNPRVKQEMDDMIKFWLDKGIDGFRVDAINHVFEDQEFRDQPLIDDRLGPSYANMDHRYTRDLEENYGIVYSWRDIFDSYKARDGHTRFMMTEAYTSLENLMKWFGNDTHRGSHMPFNFDFITTITNETRAEEYKRLIDDWIEAMPEYGSPNWVLGNHDRPRVASRFGRDRAASMAIMEMTLPGIAVVYYGEEIGMEDNRDITWEETRDPQACNGPKEDFQANTRDPVRTPFQWDNSTHAGFAAPGSSTPWLPVHPNFREVNLAAQKAAPKSLYKLYQQLIRLRKEPTFRHGDLKTFALMNNVLAFTRSLEGNGRFAVAVNVNPNDVNLNLKHLHEETNRARVVLSSLDAELQEGREITNVDNIVLGRYDAVVFQLYTDGAAIAQLSVVLLLLSILRAIFA
ncbi:maltase 1-like [Uranotaenia lowii]|uniref:maltase 1-like n=1 Tax=Uranotaenia lowii TaxID=190385 RepID=UPI00247A002D|nr:maltase 1-like [Uranotaenia lowii]